MMSRSKTTLAVIKTLETAIENRKLAEEAEKELKARLRAIMGDEAVLACFDYTVVRSDRKRVDFDRDKLREVLGERLALVQRETTYSTLELRKCDKTP
jgi:hypothetical protein